MSFTPDRPKPAELANTLAHAMAFDYAAAANGITTVYSNPDNLIITTLERLSAPEEQRAEALRTQETSYRGVSVSLLDAASPLLPHTGAPADSHHVWQARDIEITATQSGTPLHAKVQRGSEGYFWQTGTASWESSDQVIWDPSQLGALAMQYADRSDLIENIAQAGAAAVIHEVRELGEIRTDLHMPGGSAMRNLGNLLEYSHDHCNATRRAGDPLSVIVESLAQREKPASNGSLPADLHL